MQVSVTTSLVDQEMPFLCESEHHDLLRDGTLRLVFPAAVLRYAVVGGIVLRVLFEW